MNKHYEENAKTPLTFEEFLEKMHGVLYGDFLCMNAANQKMYEYYYKCYLNGMPLEL